MQALLTILSIIIGLVFVLLLFSLLASTVMEIIAAMLSLRGKHLLVTLQNMLGEQSKPFLEHPFFRQLSYAAHHRKNNLTTYKLPSWIGKSTFSAILVDILETDGDANLLQKIQNMEEGDLKKLLLFLYRQSDGTVENFRARSEQWFDEVMERATEWYKRSIKWWLFSVGLVLAAIFNADTIQIYKSLSANSTLRQDFVSMAEKTVQKTDSVRTMDLTKSLAQSKGEFKDLTKMYTEVVQSPLGLGWTESQGGGNLPGWLVKIFGLLLTGIAVTFGAPFWFEILKRLIAVKNIKIPAVDMPSPVASRTVVGSKDELNLFENHRRGAVEAPIDTSNESTPERNKPRRRRRPNPPKPTDENLKP